ncbi:MAG: hypothetical protein PHI48_07835 [Bacteroidales bacterium]|nr:hypothetical protein [Bacteroidales bacterium]
MIKEVLLKILIIAVAVPILSFIFRRYAAKKIKEKSANSRGNAQNLKLPEEKKSNDKIVYIENANFDDVKKAIQQFCTDYNQDYLRALPLLSVMYGNKHIVTFPYDIDFETYCYFVNYMHYPNNITYQPTIKAWATTNSDDKWMTSDIENKTVMIFIPYDDKEYDNVYLTTSDNIGYKIVFSRSNSSHILKEPKQKYAAPININSLDKKESISFR